MAKRKIKKKEKRVKKRWFPILAPDIFNRVVIGESVVADPEQMKGRTVLTSLMNLTHDVKQQNINLRLRVTKVENNQGLTEIVGYQLTPVAIKRMTRRRLDVVEDSQIYKTKDNQFVRLKPFLLTRHNTTNSVKSAIRKSAQDFFVRNVGDLTYTELLRDIITNKLQTNLVKRLHKIYPIRICLIREIMLDETTNKTRAMPSKVPEEEVKEVSEKEKKVDEKEEGKEETKTGVTEEAKPVDEKPEEKEIKESKPDETKSKPGPEEEKAVDEKKPEEIKSKEKVEEESKETKEKALDDKETKETKADETKSKEELDKVKGAESKDS